MFENLTEKLEKVFKDLRGYGKLTPDNVKGSLREVRLALLEADVNYNVVKEFISTISEQAVGQEVLGLCHRQLSEVEYGRCQYRIGAARGQGLVKMLECARATRSLCFRLEFL